MKGKKNYNQNAPIDLMSLSRAQLVAFGCGLRKRGQVWLIRELERLEADQTRKEVRG